MGLGFLVLLYFFILNFYGYGSCISTNWKFHEFIGIIKKFAEFFDEIISALAQKELHNLSGPPHHHLRRMLNRVASCSHRLGSDRDHGKITLRACQSQIKFSCVERLSFVQSG
jgi:hypothetical protein